MVFKQPLRQTQGLMRSLAKLLGAAILVPDFSTLSRRSNGLAPRAPRQPGGSKPVHLVVELTGLKIFGEGALSAACFACACWVIIGWRKSIKPSANGALGASYTSVLILSAVRLFARIWPKTMSAIRRRCQISWIKSTARLICFWQMELTTGSQHLICLPLGSDRWLKSRSRFQKCNTEPQCSSISDGARPPYRRDRKLRANGLAESHWLQSTQPRWNPHGALEGDYRAQAKSTRLREPENRSQNWRPSSQPDDWNWSPKFRTHRLNSVSGRARSELPLIYATPPVRAHSAAKVSPFEDEGFNWVLRYAMQFLSWQKYWKHALGLRDPSQRFKYCHARQLDIRPAAILGLSCFCFLDSR